MDLLIPDASLAMKTESTVEIRGVSTPNYGDPWLPLVESTVLELIGPMAGYSRKNLHPTRFSAVRLRALLEGVGLNGVHIMKTPFMLALVGVGWMPRG